MAADMPASSTYSGHINYHYPQPGMMRRSLPNMAHSILVHEPAKIYPYHLLLITNYRLPSDVDRCNLEVRSNRFNGQLKYGITISMIDYDDDCIV